MDPAIRLEKKRKEAQRLRDVPPAVTLEMGFSICDFARDLTEGARHALVVREELRRDGH